MSNSEPPFWWPDTKSLLAVFVVASVVALTFTLIWKPDAANSDLLKVLVGGLMTVGFATVVGYYFGSSQESRTKGDTIARIAEKSNGAAPPPKPPEAKPPSTGA